MNLEKNGIFINWQPRELAALKSATEKLMAKQPKKRNRAIKNTHNKTGVKGCYYHSGHNKFMIHALIDGKLIYAGRMVEFDKEKAIAMQQIKIEEYNNKLLQKNEN